jgi:hypothetical protein
VYLSKGSDDKERLSGSRMQELPGGHWLHSANAAKETLMKHPWNFQNPLRLNPGLSE